MIYSIKKLFTYNKVHCPCCGWKGVEFSRAGRKKRKNAKCPQCGALERHRLFYLFLKNHLPKKKPFKLLHFAPESSIAQLFKSYKNIDYLSADINPEKAMTVQDITNLTLENDTFNYVFCSHVLEHIPDDKKAIAEIYRVLKTGGEALISVPIYDLDKTYENPDIITPEGRSEHFGQEDHVRKYGRDFHERLNTKFQTVEEISYIDSIPKKKIKKYGLKDRKIYLCIKKGS